MPFSLDAVPMAAVAGAKAGGGWFEDPFETAAAWPFLDAEEGRILGGGGGGMSCCGRFLGGGGGGISSGC